MIKSLVVLLPLTTGCGSNTLPPPLSAVESARLAHTHFNATVGVEPYRWHAYSDDLRTALADTHLFISVKPLDQCSTAPTFIARIEEPYNGGVATIPIWTLLTLGIVPTVVREGFGYDFSLRSADGREFHHVHYEIRSTTTMGWIALPEALSPDVGLWSCEKSSRFSDRFALAIVDSLAEKK